MSTISNISVKDSDGTTDIVYAPVAASGGDKSPAVWLSTAVGSAAAFKPSIQISSRNNGTNSARRVEITATYPSIVTGSDGIPRVVDKFILTATAILPKAMSDADLRHATTQFTNMFYTPMVQGSVATGYAPT